MQSEARCWSIGHSSNSTRHWHILVLSNSWLFLYLSADRQQCALNWKYLTGFWGIDKSHLGAKALQPWRDKRMCLGHPVKPIQLSTVKVCRFGVRMCVCMRALITVGQLFCSLNILCDTKMAWRPYSQLVLPLYEEQTVLIGVTDTISTLQPTAAASVSLSLTEWVTDFTWQTKKALFFL